MLILDTSVWIEFLKKNPDYFPIVTPLLEDQEIIAVECVFGELLQGVKTKYEEETIMQYWEHLPKIEYPQVMIEAGLYSSKNKLLDYGVGLIDATILMHGIKSQSPIWTLDTKFLRIIPRELIFNGAIN